MSKRGNNEGSISKRKDGRWWGRYTLNTPDGPRQMGVYGKTRSEVAEKLRRIMADLDRGLVFGAGNLKLGEHLDRWLSDCLMPLVEAGKLEYSSYVRYEGVVRNHLKPSLAHRKLKDLNRVEVRALYRKKGKHLSPRTVDYIHVTLQKALKQAVRDDLIPRNVAEGERPRSSRNREEAKAFSAAQVRDLLAASKGTRNHPLYVVAVHTGLRQGEILGLKWTDIDLEGSPARLTVRRSLKVVAGGLGFGPPKNKPSRRSVPLNKTAVAALREHRLSQNEERLRATLWRDENLVFPSRTGSPMDHNNLYTREYKKLLEECGLQDEGFTFHTLRHTFATELFNQKKRPKVIQTLLGHASITQTMDTYSHLLDDVGDDEVEGLDDAFG